MYKLILTCPPKKSVTGKHLQPCEQPMSKQKNWPLTQDMWHLFDVHRATVYFK